MAKLLAPNSFKAPNAELIDGIDSSALAQKSFRYAQIDGAILEADGPNDTLYITSEGVIKLVPDASLDAFKIKLQEDSEHRFVTDLEKSKIKEVKNSTVNGNILIEGEEVSVYKHPTGNGFAHIPASFSYNAGHFLMATSIQGQYEWKELKVPSMDDLYTKSQIDDLLSGKLSTTDVVDEATPNKILRLNDEGKFVVDIQGTASNALALDGRYAGNFSQNIPINNSVLNVGLNAEMIDGLYAKDLALKNHSHDLATADKDGFISKTDKAKLDTIYEGATKVQTHTNGKLLINGVESEVYSHPSTHSAAMIVEDDSRRFVTNAQISSWNEKINSLQLQDKINQLKGSVSSNLDTLEKISNAINNDANYHTTVTNLLKDKSDIGHIHSTANSVIDGFMSREDKVKLDDIENGANKYIHPTSHPASMIVEDDNKRFLSTKLLNKLENISDQATNTTSSSINGNIKINGVETKVYTHPSKHTANEITQDENNRFVSDAEKNTWNEKQDNLGYRPLNTEGDTMNGDIIFDGEHSLNWNLLGKEAGIKLTKDGLVTNVNDKVIYTNSNVKDVHDNFNSLELKVKDSLNLSQSLIVNGGLNLKKPRLNLLTVPYKNNMDIGEISIIRNNQKLADPDVRGSLIDIEVNVDEYTGSKPLDFLIKIKNVSGNPNTFCWGHTSFDTNVNDNNSWQGVDIPLSTNWIVLGNNVKIKFNKTAGGIQGETFGFTVLPGGAITSESNTNSTFNGDILIKGKKVVTEGHVHTLDSITETDNKKIMTANEREKLKNISENASNVSDSQNNGYITIDGSDVLIYEHPEKHPAAMIQTDSNNRFISDSLINKLNGISNQANKVSDSDINGNIKIDNVEVNVYQHPESHSADMIITNNNKNFISRDQLNKLANISESANKTERSSQNGYIKIDNEDTLVYSHPSKHSASMITEETNKRFMTDSERSKLGNISENATNTQESSINGNIKIDGQEVVVYTHPEKHNATDIIEDNEHKFVTQTEKNTWNNKQDKIGYVPVNKSGDTMTGDLRVDGNISSNKTTTNEINVSEKFVFKYNTNKDSLDLVYVS